MFIGTVGEVYSLKYQGFFAILKEMLISILKSKIHMATVTDTQPYYEGSIAIDKKLIKAAGLIPGKKSTSLILTTATASKLT